MAELTFYRCNKCGNLVMVVDRGACVPTCCGEPMEKLVAGSVDAAAEKHVPFIERDDKHMVVKVGEVAHPMTEEHYIEWIAVAAEGKTIIKYLKPGEEPTKTFCKKFEDHGTVYAYCNLHGLWKAEF